MDVALAGNKDEQLLELVQQWNQITAKRDTILHRRVEQQALLTKYRSMLALLKTLKETAAAAKASSPSEFHIRCNVKDLLIQVEGFCRKNNVTEAVCAMLERNVAKYTMPKAAAAVTTTTAAAVAANIPPPPPLPTMAAVSGFIPPPPPMPPSRPASFASLNKALLALPKRGAADRLKKSSGGKAVQFRSPLKSRSINTDVLSQITKGGKSMLKQTPFKCSPGGTPFKPKFRSSSGDLEAALKKKFQSVMINSPLGSPMPNGASPCPFGTPGNENMMSPMVATELDSSACGTPYTEPVFMAPVIDARPYEGTPEPVA